VLEWAALTGQFDQVALAELEQMNTAEPGAGKRALHRLRGLRETIHDVLAATIQDESPPEKALARLELLWKDALARARLTVSDRHARIELSVESSRLDYLKHELALRAFELLQVFPSTAPVSVRARIAAGCSSTAPRAEGAAGATWPPAATQQRTNGTTSENEPRRSGSEP
jgi:putative stress-induced transcription regulator